MNDNNNMHCHKCGSKDVWIRKNKTYCKECCSTNRKRSLPEDEEDEDRPKTVLFGSTKSCSWSLTFSVDFQRPKLIHRNGYLLHNQLHMPLIQKLHPDRTSKGHMQIAAQHWKNLPQKGIDYYRDQAKQLKQMDQGQVQASAKKPRV